MNLSKISNEELLLRLKKLSHSERKITHLILCHIIEVDSRRLWADIGYDSLLSYMKKDLGYAEDSAYRRMRAADLLKKVPEVAAKIEDGTLNLTQLNQVQKCIRQEEKSGNTVNRAQTSQLLEQIQNLNTYDTQKFLAVEFNQPIQQLEVIKPQRDDSVRVEMTFTAEQMTVLRKAKDLFCLLYTSPSPRDS